MFRPHVQVIDNAVFLEKPGKLDVIFELHAVIDHVVVHPHADKSIGSQFAPRRQDHLA
jgi:hypothetical protein